MHGLGLDGVLCLCIRCAVAILCTSSACDLSSMFVNVTDCASYVHAYVIPKQQIMLVHSDA